MECLAAVTARGSRTEPVPFGRQLGESVLPINDLYLDIGGCLCVLHLSAQVGFHIADGSEPSRRQVTKSRFTHHAVGKVKVLGEIDLDPVKIGDIDWPESNPVINAHLDGAFEEAIVIAASRTRNQRFAFMLEDLVDAQNLTLAVG